MQWAAFGSMDKIQSQKEEMRRVSGKGSAPGVVTVPQKEVKLYEDGEKEMKDQLHEGVCMSSSARNAKEPIQNGKDKTINTMTKRSGIQIKPTNQTNTTGNQNKTKSTQRTQFYRSH